MADITFPDPTITNPYWDGSQWWKHDGDGWLPLCGEQPDGLLTGFKNILINGDFRINQRGITDWTSILASNYAWDRWAKWDPDYMYQYIEDVNLSFGEIYTLSWEGGGIGRVICDVPFEGTSPVSGVLASPVAADTVRVKLPHGVTNVQLEKGSVATPFEIRPIGLEYQLCYRYYYKYNQTLRMLTDIGSSTTISRICNFPFPVKMRATPVVSYYIDQGSSTVVVDSTGALYSSVVSSGTIVANIYGGSTYDAEL